MTERMKASEYQQALRDSWTEAEFTTAVIRLFQENSWLVAHFRPARTEKGWRTAVQGDSGFPDIVAAKDGRVVFAELKVKGRRPSPEQMRWLDELPNLSDFATHEVYVWWPSAWPVIERIAQGK